jgi:hypothetical protein
MSISDSSEINGSKKIRTSIMTFAALASFLVLSSFSATQLIASNAYAQSSTRTVTGSCEFNRDANLLSANFVITGSEQDDTVYYDQLVDSSGKVLQTQGPFNLGGSYSFSWGHATPGEQYTENLYVDVDDDFHIVGVEEDELLASDTATCPSYTDLFRNEGQCIKYVRTHPNGDITKSGCQAAF